MQTIRTFDGRKRNGGDDFSIAENLGFQRWVG
jgi:hypothetical protein